MAIQATKIDAGIYNIDHNGHKYELERDEWGIWVLYEQTKNSEWNGREYCNDFKTKRQALEAIELND